MGKVREILAIKMSYKQFSFSQLEENNKLMLLKIIAVH